MLFGDQDKQWLSCDAQCSSHLRGLETSFCLLALCWFCFFKVGRRQEEAPRGSKEIESIATATHLVTCSSTEVEALLVLTGTLPRRPQVSDVNRIWKMAASLKEIPGELRGKSGP